MKCIPTVSKENGIYIQLEAENETERSILRVVEDCKILVSGASTSAKGTESLTINARLRNGAT